MSTTPLGPMYRRAVAFVLFGAVALVAGCEGSNLFRDLPTGGTDDGLAPTVQIAAPEDLRRVAIQDSVLVQVRVSDPGGIAAVELTGFALRGNTDLGTSQVAPRFLTKTVEFDGTVTDTVLARYLLATADTAQDDSVYVVVTAVDLGGASSADTVIVSIGGPRVDILSPASGSEIRAGTTMPVRVSASDPLVRLQELTVMVRGGFTLDTTIVLDPPSVDVDTVIRITVPSTARDEVQVSAAVLSTSNDTATSATVDIELVAPIQDEVAPAVTFSVQAPQTAERDDSISVFVTAEDSTEVREVGITILPIHRLSSSTDTLTVLRMTRPGDQASFTFALDQLGVPEPSDTSTLRIEVTAFATDTAANCATATVPATELSESCRSVGGHTFANRPGARWEVLVVRGITVPLSTASDRIADIASDGERVFLSNISRNRLDVIEVG
jgi:hypothetical protein